MFANKVKIMNFIMRNSGIKYLTLYLLRKLITFLFLLITRSSSSISLFNSRTIKTFSNFSIVSRF
ncbi:hypothetical protein HMPREF0208_00504 [Citrobacter koseri]|nr:hypothetical protein HMPREF3220_01316 [Citrobacter koseri]KXA05464.1 hypothetical protein HMPREF3207_00813 [Citrobacter koseri]KXB46887.1 hypothetical protein HMPREF0208_00504 [Citrobacter koseri]